MAQQDLLVVVNGAAGTARQAQVRVAMSALHAAAQVTGAAVELVATNDVQELADTLGALADRRLVVLGGDGSVHAAVQGLHETGRLRAAGPIGIVPLGTGNDLARFLGVPTDPADAARAALTGTARDMGLLVADDGQVAVNAVHVGVGAAAAVRGAGAKRRLGKVRLGRFGYPLGAVAAGFTERRWRLRVTVDGAVLHDGDERVLMVAMGVGGTVGGGAQLVPAADPDDGLIDVVVSLAVGPWARLRYALDLRNGSHVRRRDVRSGRGQGAEVQAAPGQTFPGNGDGEFRGPFTFRRWHVEPGAWQVILPRTPATT